MASITKTPETREYLPSSAFIRVRMDSSAWRRVKIAAWDRSDGHCWYCGDRMNPFRDFSVDHVVPISSGGVDEPTNLVPCCRSCNGGKRDRSLESFRAMQAKKSASHFSAAQMQFLRDHGIDLPKELPFQFAFEREGWV